MENYRDEYFEKSYDEIVANKKRLAELIAKAPFHGGLSKFSKKDYLTLIFAIEDKIAFEKGWYEYDAKDFVFECKCFLIESLDPDYFSREGK